MIARTVPVDGDADLLAFCGEDGYLFARDGAGLAAREVAARVPAGDVAAVLASIDTDDAVGLPGCGPVAVGALPYDPAAAAGADLVIPRVVLGRAADGTAWLTVVGEDDAAIDAAAPALDVRSDASAPDAFTLTATVPHAEWLAIVDAALAEIKDGTLGKVVLAREVAVETNRAIVVSQVLARLATLYPSCTVFSVDGFVGASPELLVSRTGDAVASHPLAGTIPHSGDPDVDRRAGERLLASTKDREEHAFVVADIAGALAPLCETLDVPGTPAVVAFRNVAHLGTRLTGRLAPPAPTALELALRLHPTPAVGGTPTEAAVAYQREVERFDRGRYAGPVGWVDRRGDGAFWVGIRSAEIAGTSARLFAGVGVVDGSVPEEELAETQLKLQALLAAVVRP